MTTKTKKLVWAILIILLAACSGDDSFVDPTSVSFGSVGNCNLGVEIDGPENRLFTPGDEIELRASKKSNSWDLLWSTKPLEFSGNFSSVYDAETIFITPNLIGPIDILLVVSAGADCQKTYTFSIVVVASSELGQTVEETVPTYTPLPIATPVPTPEPIETPTIEPSPTPEPTETATLSPMPTISQTSTATPSPYYNAPVITYLELLPGGAVRVEWSWDGQLSPAQNFAVRFWSVNDPRPEARFSITWAREYSYQFSVDNTRYPIGTYYVNIAVMEGPSEGIHYELSRSIDVPIDVVAPEPSPPGPACPPACS